VGTFLNRRLADVQPADLVAVQVGIATANQIVAAIGGVVAVTTEPNLGLSDMSSG
jgi:L-lactate utilization protein LutB